MEPTSSEAPMPTLSPVTIPNGKNGINDTNGTNGINGINGVNGINGINGVNGINGINGVNGINGINGINGVNSNKQSEEVNWFGKIDSSYKIQNSNAVREQSFKAEGEAPPPIAIVGMGMRLPGGVNGEDDFWDLLINKKNGRCVVPEDRYNIDAFYSPTGGHGTVKAKHGYFLDHVDLRNLDASFFSMNKSEVERLDPQQKLLLEVIWECMESGGQVGWRGKNIGCYVGVFGEDWLDMAAKDTQHLGMYRITGSGDFAISNRISYEYDLRGPSMTIRTGCSSALISLHEACQAIYSGECHSAIVAGTNLIITPTMTIAMTEQGVLSPTGLCKTFDAKADGYARGEAINAIYVKKLSDALRDGDPVRAVIRATATNCDGKTPGMACPSSESHESMMRRAYQVAQLPDLSKTAFIECHGTGTVVGDPLEAAAVANVFGHNGIFIGSVKPNVGHSEGASGITSLIKTVLALEHKIIPPNINFSEPNPKIPFKKAQLHVPLEAIPWPENSERASVNSFGIGGANAHVVVDSAASFGVRQSVNGDSSLSSSRPYLLVFSANHPESLKRSISSYQNHIASHPHLLEDLAHTLGTRREHLPYRAFCVTNGEEPFETSLPTKSKLSPQVVFVFTGQGAQWVGMAKQLLENFPGFQDDIRAMDNALAELEVPPSWTIEGELAEVEGNDRIDEAEFSQPLCTAVQIGVVNLFRSWGVFPAAVIGHSSGEIAAAYTSNAITAKAAIIIAYYRGQLSGRQACSGGMLAVGMGKNNVTPYLTEGVVVACENSPESVTLSGDRKQINKIANNIADKEPEIFVRHLKVRVAYHSHHMVEVGADYEALINSQVSTKPFEVPFFSTVIGKAIHDSKQLRASYWRRNLESPVLFHSATQAVLDRFSQESIFLEIGPHSALAGPLRQIFKAAETSTKPIYIPSLVRGKNSTGSLLTAVGQMHLLNVPIKFEVATPGRTVLTNLPTYPWNHDSKYWNESRITREWRTRRFPKHELLGSRILEGNELEPTWRNILSLEDVPWVQDHKIIDDVVFPAAGYITMAGEAIRQLTDLNDFTLRHVLIKTALVLQDSKKIEMMTSLHRVPFTTSLDSDWYEVVVSAYNGTSWTKHFIGQVRAGREQPIQVQTVGTLSREISASAWYLAMKRVGLNYGPSFQKLTDISAGPNSGTSVASLFDEHRSNGALYQLHPSTIDMCLQLFTVAVTEGTARRLQKLCVPTEIEELYICQGIPQMRAKVNASVSSSGIIMGDAVAMAGNETVLQLKGGKFSPLENRVSTDFEDTVAGAQLDWKPDIEFMHGDELMRPCKVPKEDIVKIERLALLCILETHYQVSCLETTVDHLKKFQTWLAVQVGRAESGTYALIEEAPRLASLSHNERLDSIKIASTEVEQSVSAGVGKILLRILGQCKAIFAEQIDPIDVLLQEDGLKILYDFFQDMWDCQKFFELLGHSKPNLRVLEIGAGTGGTTTAALKDLRAGSGERMYSEYCYTDISAGFFITAKERFKDFENIKYAVLDISKDPVEQGFEAESYDLILASNVLHATPNIHSTLRNVRKLLHPQGQLLLQELAPTLRKINYIMGILPGWWLGDSDDRLDEPYISVKRWDKELRAAGFSGTNSIVYDNDLPYQINVNIISSPTKNTPYSKDVTLLCDRELSPIVLQVKAVFVRNGFRVNFSTLDQLPPANQDVISLIDLNAPFFDAISSENLSAFQRYVGNLKSSGILWVTRSSQIGCKDPRYSQVLGTARTARSELLIDFATFEIDIVDDFALEALSKVFFKFQKRTKGPETDPDYEFALFERTVMIPRYCWISVEKQLAVVSGEELPRKLQIGKPGLLQSLQWVQEKPIVLAQDDIEVETCAVGLNFKDVLVCMGIVDATKDGIGLEGAGIVQGVGPEVNNFKVGDRVIMFEHGCFSTRIKISSKLCTKIPSDLSFEEAATFPCVYSTAIHSLLTIGRLEKGQTVLIQSACGGVGLAAIQICKMIGAQIFATVGNDEKAQYLMTTHGISRHHIFNSRNSSFLTDIQRETNGRGVDIVLNSLSGELLHTSWKCVAEYGKMLEIGKRDFIGRGMLSMDLFEANRGFFGIDLARLSIERPEVCRILLEECMEYYRQGAIGPIKPMKVFDARQIVDAFKYMQKGQHIGKIVVTMPKSPQELSVTAVKHKLHLRPEASYLLVGGLGGLGRAISTWMVERGARNLVFLSRSAGKSDGDQNFFRELEVQGCTVQAFSGSISCLDDVKNAVQSAAAPIAGVMHMSMVLSDRGFLDFTYDEWRTAVAPKVDGAWNLHEALTGHELDFFVLFSSVSCIVGQRGQGNYAAANTFLDSFVQYRHSLGLPASAIDIGVMEDVGYVSHNPAVLEQLKATSTHTLQEQDLIDALQLVMTERTAPSPSAAGYKNPAQLAIGLRSTKLLSDPSNRILWRRDIRMSQYKNLETVTASSSGAANEDLKQFLAAVAKEPSMLNQQSKVDFLTHEIGMRLCNFMLQPEEDIDIKQPLSAMGMDSLIAIEIRNWWRQTLKLEISILEIINSGSIEQLGKNASEGLKRKYEVPLQSDEDTYLLMKAP